MFCSFRVNKLQYAAVAHLVERHLAKVEVASSSLVGRSRKTVKYRLPSRFFTNMVTWPSGKARVCKTLIHQFKSGRHLQKEEVVLITTSSFLCF